MSATKIKYWLPVFLWMGVIFFSSSRSVISTSDVYLEDFIIKKTAHFVVYFILGFLVYRSLKNTTHLPKPKLIFWTILICGLYAVSDEVHQSFVPGRGPHVRDVVIDIVGIVGAVLMKSSMKKETPRKLNSQ